MNFVNYRIFGCKATTSLDLINPRYMINEFGRIYDTEQKDWVPVVYLPEINREVVPLVNAYDNTLYYYYVREIVSKYCKGVVNTKKYQEFVKNGYKLNVVRKFKPIDIGHLGLDDESTT